MTNLKASTSRRWHFCLLTTQKPAHPVGSSRSRGLLHIGTSSSTRATHTSPSRQSSQYLVVLLMFWLVASVSAPSLDAGVLPGNDGSPFKGAPMVNASWAIVSAIIAVMLAVAIVRFDSSFGTMGVFGTPEVKFCPVNLLVDDFRYCWMIWSFSGSKREKGRDQSSRVEKARYRVPATAEVRMRPRLKRQEILYILFGLFSF